MAENMNQAAGDDVRQPGGLGIARIALDPGTDQAGGKSAGRLPAGRRPRPSCRRRPPNGVGGGREGGIVRSSEYVLL